MGKIMIALGGNALGNSPAEQRELVKHAVKPIADLIELGHQVVIAHGNGPQVGMIKSALQMAQAVNRNIPDIPLNDCVSMSQAYIGNHVQAILREELMNRGISNQVVSLVTQVVVSKDDPAFQNPTKPIGMFYTKEEADEKAKSENITFVEDSGRGYRQVVASPAPVRIVEADVIRDLVSAGQVVITIGGGGIPVFEEGNALIAAQAVIDKDAASGKLAEELDMDYLFIFTAVDKVSLNYGKENQVDLNNVSLEEARQWIAEGQFPPGSMLPKVESAIRFVEYRLGRKAIITSLEKAGKAVQGETGTHFYNEAESSVACS